MTVLMVRVVAALVASLVVGDQFMRWETDLTGHDTWDCPQGHDRNLGEALWCLKKNPVAAIWKGGGDLF